MQKKPLRELSLPSHVGKVFDDNDRLVARDFYVEDRSEWHRLKKLGGSYYLPAGKTDQNEPVDREAPVSSEELVEEDPEEYSNQVEENRNRYHKVLNKMNQTLGETLQERVPFDELRGPFEEDMDFLIDQALETPGSLSALSQLRTFDDVTFEHSLNVCVLSILYANYRGFPRDEVEKLAFGALFHDLGKTGLSAEIITKPTHPSADEWESIRQHPEVGGDILEEIEADSIYQRIALEHHERPDGTGYPEGRIEVHPLSRIVAVCDVYEALTANRSYKDPYSPLKSFMLLRDEFGAYPETRKIVAGLIKALGLFPVGSLVELSNGEIAIVKDTYPRDPRRPSVVVVTDRHGHLLNYPVTVNLERIVHQKKAAHGEIYDSSISINKLLPLKDHPELRGQVGNLIEKKKVLSG